MKVLAAIENKSLFSFNMNQWLLILFSIFISISVSGILRFILNRYFINTKPTLYKLPPSPQSIPVISNLLQLLRISPSDIHSNLNSLHAKLGPIITIYSGSRPVIFIAGRFLAHKALVQNGAMFANRPPASATQKIVSSNQRLVSLAFYGPTWRLLRRNLTENFLHPSRAKCFSLSRRWVLQILLNRLESQEKSGQPICVKEHFQYAMFCLLVVMCFGDNVDETQIKQIEEVQRRAFLSFNKFIILNLWPRMTRIVLRRRWKEFYQLRKCQQDVSIPLIRARKNLQEEERKRMETQHHHVASYVDTLLGRRICPGYQLAMLHLEYYVANLIWKFEWKAVDGDDVDLSEKAERLMVMKTPLQVHLSPR
uniref:Cytochrome P450 89A2-like n=1 Tax=Populus alba TaxID=43335 RepID=A0A4U5Q048_POPAL|nr:hypothetical protein D5086_0000157800 [Populus alba]